MQPFMIPHIKIYDNELRRLIKNRLINFGGNKQLKIYGHLQCRSGKRMKKENRIFFSSTEEAIALGYRPCGHCMYKAFKDYKKMDLFSKTDTGNLLPYDGIVTYYGKILSQEKAAAYFDSLL